MLRQLGLGRGRTTGFYLTRRHEALIAAIGDHYNRRSHKPTNASVVVQILIEHEAKRLKLAQPEMPAMSSNPSPRSV